jgi:hypothetical protein
MTSSPHLRSIRRVVRFAQTEADQALLQAVEEALEKQFYGNFSALCKQAIRHFLLPDQASQMISPIVMQEQIIELQERVARLEAMGDRPIPPEHLTAPSPAELPEPPPEIDPLLSRLALLLEDF